MKEIYLVTPPDELGLVSLFVVAVNSSAAILVYCENCTKSQAEFVADAGRIGDVDVEHIGVAMTCDAVLSYHAA